MKKLTQVVFKQQEKGEAVTLDTIKNDVTFKKELYDKKIWKYDERLSLENVLDADCLNSYDE